MHAWCTSCVLLLMVQKKEQTSRREQPTWEWDDMTPASLTRVGRATAPAATTTSSGLSYACTPGFRAQQARGCNANQAGA